MFLQKFINRASSITIGAALLGLNACSIDEDLAKPKFSPDFSLPLVYGSMSLQNLLKDTSLIQTDPTGYLKVGFSDTVTVIEAGDPNFGAILDIGQPEAAIPAEVAFDNIGGGNEQLSTAEMAYDFNFSVSTLKLQKLALDEAEIVVKLQNAKAYDITGLIVDIPGLKNNGGAGAFVSTGSIDVASGQEAEFTIQLTDAVWDLHMQPGDTSIARMAFRSASGTPIQGPAGGSLFASVSFVSKPNVKYWKGAPSTLFKTLLQTLPSTTTNNKVLPASAFSFIKAPPPGSPPPLGLSEIDVNLTFQTRLGLPLGMNFILGTFSGLDNGYVEMNPPLNVQIPADFINTTTNLPERSDTVLQLNSSSSNIADVLTNFPSAVKVGVGGGSTFDDNKFDYFMHDSSDMRLLVDAVIPLAVNFNHLVVVDTFAFSMAQELPEQATLDAGDILFTLTNAFPYGFNIKITALDENNLFVDSVAVIDIDAATAADPTDANRVLPSAPKDIAIELTTEKFENIKKAVSLKVEAELDNSSSSGRNRVYTDYTLGFTSRARLKVTYDTAKGK